MSRKDLPGLFDTALNEDDAAENALLVRRAEEGDAEAQNTVGIRIWDGTHGMKSSSYAAGVRWLLRAYANGVKNKSRLLYANEHGLIAEDEQLQSELSVVVKEIRQEQDAEKAFVTSLEKKADSGDAAAALTLAKAHLSREHGLSLDHDKATQWLMKAYTLGNVDALANLRELYANRLLLGTTSRDELERFMKPILQSEHAHEAISEKGFRAGTVAAIAGFVGTLIAIQVSGTAGLIRETSLLWALSVAFALFVLVYRA